MATAPLDPRASETTDPSDGQGDSQARAREASEDTAALASSEDRWRRDVLGPALAERGERKESFVTQQMHWPVKDLYTPNDLAAAGFDYQRDVGFPGEYAQCLRSVSG